MPTIRNLQAPEEKYVCSRSRATGYKRHEILLPVSADLGKRTPSCGSGVGRSAGRSNGVGPHTWPRRRATRLRNRNTVLRDCSAHGRLPFIRPNADLAQSLCQVQLPCACGISSPVFGLHGIVNRTKNHTNFTKTQVRDCGARAKPSRSARSCEVTS